VPAVLFELAFISNDLDAANLTSAKWREKTMTAVADAIDAYFLQPPEAGQAVGAASGR
jgi:N-acetylmuramoyl-L-alanine amidase